MTITTEHLTYFEFRNTFPPLEYRDAFYLFDQDENGYITSKELHDIMRTLGFNVNEQELQQIILNVDYDSKSTPSRWVIPRVETGGNLFKSNCYTELESIFST